MKNMHIYDMHSFIKCMMEKGVKEEDEEEVNAEMNLLPRRA